MVMPIGDDNTGRSITPLVNYALLAANVLVFVFFQGMGAKDRFTYAFSTVPQEIVSGKDIETPPRTVEIPGTGQAVNTTECREMKGIGACWALIGEKYRFILFGLYPFDEQWRPAICIAIFVGLYVVSAMRRFWRRELLFIWIAALTVIGILMWGGVFGLPYVEQERWGGLIITLILSTFGIALAFPLAIFVALGRRAHNLPAVKALCVVYIELIRGV